MTTNTAAATTAYTTEDLQARLNAMPGYSNGNYRDGIWFFDFEHRPQVIIHFVEIYEIVGRHIEWYKKLGLDIIDLSKRAWLDSVSLSNPDKWRARLSGIALFWTALAESNISRLTLDNLTVALKFLLTHSWRNSRHFRLNGVQSYVNFSALVPLLKFKRTFNALENGVIDGAITESNIKKAISKILPSLYDGSMTYADWRAGGSHNHLTLDFGQYYIEHCMDFFEEHVALANANASVFRKIPALAKEFSLGKDKITKFVTKILEGKSLEQIRSETFMRRLGWEKNAEKLNFLYRSCVGSFESVYRDEHFKTFILKDASLERLLISVEAECSASNVDRLRIIIWEWLKSNRTHYDLDLIKNFSPSISAQRLESEIRAMESIHSSTSYSIPNHTFYESLGLEVQVNAFDSWRIPPRLLVQKVEQAGLTLIVALTGWRRTEYGFPLTALRSTTNHDILDRYAFPKRYHINWYVKKTHGEQMVEREITFDIALLIERLAHLISSTFRKPCLYKSMKSNRHDSSIAVQVGVFGLWKHFVKNYKGFSEIQDLSMWHDLASVEGCLSAVQTAEKARLLRIRSEDEWNHQYFNVNLYECWRRANDELPVVDFALISSKSDRKNKWLIQYRNGTLPTDWRELVDRRLTQEMRDWIMSLTDTEANTGATSRAVTLHILADCLYPTPHAFRHMFAEAVYRRYDGDVGWMIRSCFKHVTRVMWQAYIRDKFNRASLDVANLNIRNSIVLNYLRKRGKGYSGPIHKWLRRLLKNSLVMTAEEQREFADRISTVEIVDVKANPWGYCLLKKRSRSRAQCAEYGEPQRQNASPSKCLSCTHNLIQSGNVDWLLLHLQTHVDLLGNDVVPALFKRSSYNLVKDVTKQILNLDPTHEALDELQAALTLNSYMRT